MTEPVIVVPMSEIATPSPSSTRRHHRRSSSGRSSKKSSSSKSSHKSSSTHKSSSSGSKPSHKSHKSHKSSSSVASGLVAAPAVSTIPSDVLVATPSAVAAMAAHQKSRSKHSKTRSNEKSPKGERRRRPSKRSCCSSSKRCPHHAVITFDDDCAGEVDLSGDDCFDSTDFLGDSIFDDDLIDESKEYTCMTESQLLEEQNKEVQSLAELLALSPVTAAALLRKFQWKKETLLTRYFENPDKIFKDAGIKRETVFRPSPSPIRIPSESQSQTASNLCSICGEDDLDPDQVFSLSCGHTFCTMCWEQYLSVKISEGQISDITCPAINCELLVDENTVRLLVSPDTFARYRRFTVHSFVDTNEYVKWCPAAGCGNAVNIDSVKNQTVTCSCGYRFCFACGEPAHRPATCEQWKSWKAKSNDESETGHWLAANTQPCPKCGSHTEKNGGCNHMVCRHPSCGYEYCWKCTKEWKGHTNFYNCSRWERQQKKMAKRETKKGKGKPSKWDRLQQQEENRKLLERYLRHFDKFIELDRTDEKALREAAGRKAQQWHAQYGVAADVAFIERATEILIECRRALKYSYVTSYYLDELDTKRSLFEFIQADLEKSVQTLAEVLDYHTIPKQQALDAARIAETRLRTILESSEPL